MSEETEGTVAIESPVTSTPQEEIPDKVPYTQGTTELKKICDENTTEDVLRVLIEKMYSQHCPCDENKRVIIDLEDALIWLNKLTESRKARQVEGKQIA